MGLGIYRNTKFCNTSTQKMVFNERILNIYFERLLITILFNSVVSLKIAAPYQHHATQSRSYV